MSPPSHCNFGFDVTEIWSKDGYWHHFVTTLLLGPIKRTVQEKKKSKLFIRSSVLLIVKRERASFDGQFSISMWSTKRHRRVLFSQNYVFKQIWILKPSVKNCSWHKNLTINIQSVFRSLFSFDPTSEVSSKLPSNCLLRPIERRNSTNFHSPAPWKHKKLRNIYTHTHRSIWVRFLFGSCFFCLFVFCFFLSRQIITVKNHFSGTCFF